MLWTEAMNLDNSGLLPPAEPALIESIAKRFGVVFPQEYTDFLLWADGGFLPGKEVIIYSAGAGLDPAETLSAANDQRPANFPLFLVGRDAFEEFGFLRSDLQQPSNAAAVYMYLHETDTVRRMADSFASFVRTVVSRS